MMSRVQLRMALFQMMWIQSMTLFEQTFFGATLWQVAQVLNIISVRSVWSLSSTAMIIAVVTPCVSLRLHHDLISFGFSIDTGYSNPNHDTNCEDFRPRANMWVQSKHALDFFAKFKVPFQNMSNDNSRVTNDNWCLADATESIVVVYLRNGGTADINLSGLGNGSADSLTVGWYNPRQGGSLDQGSVTALKVADYPQSLGNAPYDSDKDWVVLLGPS